MIARAAVEPLPLLTIVLAAAGLPVLAWLAVRRFGGRPLFARHPRPFGRVEPTVLYMLAIAIVLVQQFCGTLAFQQRSLSIIAAGVVVTLAVGHVVLGPRLHPRFGIGGRLARGLLAVWAALPLIYGLHYLLGLVFGESRQAMVELIGERRPGWLVAVGAALFLAPVAEETAFRGALYAALRRRFGPAAAIALSSALFGLIHFDAPTAWLPLALLGATLAWTVEATGSLLPAFAGHLAFNLLTVGELLFAGA